jgi:hypothetical protein
MSKRPQDLVAGKDYDWINVTDDMDPAEKRRARIANAKSKSAAVKALKAAGATAGPAQTAAPAAAPAGQQQAAPAAAATTAAPVGGEPVAGVDYEFIEISDDMDPAVIRKARISNAKAKSAAMKAWKESGGTAAAAAAPEPAAEAAPAAAPGQEAAAASTADISAIPKPDLIEISDDMDPADIRKARISNAKATSTYKKALIAAGIDPSTVEI